MFSSMIDEAAAKFDLGGKAGTLLSALLSLITDNRQGGFAGFLDRFKKAGLGDTAKSWVSSGANTPLSYEQLESAFGEETLKNISGQVGLDYKKTVFASAFMIPHIVDQLTSEGIVPHDNDLLSRIGKYLTEDEETALAESLETEEVFQTDENTALNWLLPLILLVFLLLIGYMFCGGRQETATPSVPANVNRVINSNVNQ